MRLNALLEAASANEVKQFALHLQQLMLDKYDGLESVELQNLTSTACPPPSADKLNWRVELHLRFESWPDYQPIIDVEQDDMQPGPGCLVGITRRGGEADDHVYFHSSTTGACFPNAHAVLDELDRVLMSDMAQHIHRASKRTHEA